MFQDNFEDKCMKKNHKKDVVLQVILSIVRELA